MEPRPAMRATSAMKPKTTMRAGKGGGNYTPLPLHPFFLHTPQWRHFPAVWGGQLCLKDTG